LALGSHTTSRTPVAGDLLLAKEEKKKDLFLFASHRLPATKAKKAKDNSLPVYPVQWNRSKLAPEFPKKGNSMKLRDFVQYTQKSLKYQLKAN